MSEEATIKTAILADLDRQARDGSSMPYVGEEWGDPEMITLDGDFDLDAMSRAIATALRGSATEETP